jgi:hypothetical protein
LLPHPIWSVCESIEERELHSIGTEKILVVVISRTAPASLRKPEFDKFLFSSLGEDRNGMEVSVLSGLARSDLDPWHEAAKLADLPGKTAIERLIVIIEMLPGKVLTHTEARAVATRLIALLPRTQADDTSVSQPPNNLGAAINSRSWLVYAMLMSFVLGSQFVIAIWHRQPPTQQGDVGSAGVMLPTQPPVNSGQ